MAEFKPGDQVRWSSGDKSTGRVVRVWREQFHRGGEQQVAEVAERGTGKRFSMRSEHLKVIEESR